MTGASSKTVFYFGYVPKQGHCLRTPDGWTSYNIENIAPGCPWAVGLMDSGLLRNGNHPDIEDGRVYWTCGAGDWLAFFWWDRSGDHRPNSNSGFYVRGFDHTERSAAFDFACAKFPGIVARQRHMLALQP